LVDRLVEAEEDVLAVRLAVDGVDAAGEIAARVFGFDEEVIYALEAPARLVAADHFEVDLAPLAMAELVVGRVDLELAEARGVGLDDRERLAEARRLLLRIELLDGQIGDRNAGPAGAEAAAAAPWLLGVRLPLVPDHDLSVRRRAAVGV